MKRIMMSLLLTIAAFAEAQIKCPGSLPVDICDFDKQVYTETDFKSAAEVKELMIKLKNLFMSHVHDSPLIQEHLLVLGDHIIEEAYKQRAPKSILAMANGKEKLSDMLNHLRKWEAVNGQIVPLDWHLPEDFIIGITSLDRSYDVSTDKLRYAISFFSSLKTKLDFEQFKISRFGGATIIDKQAGIGTWHEGQMSIGDNYPYLSVSSSFQESPMDDGLYLLTIKIKNQNAVEGWFILHGTSTANPTVFNPQLNESFMTSNPTFRFQDFKSSALLTSDSRKLSLSVMHEGDNSTIWKSSFINPNEISAITLGRGNNQKGEKDLLPGHYRIRYSFEERSFFGDLTVGRLIKTTIPFSISK